MSTPSERFKQQKEQASSLHTPTGVRLQVRRASEEELVEVSPAFRIMKQYPVQQPSAAQWREFTRQLTEKLDKEAEKHSRFPMIQTIRDKFTSTDSVSMRVFGYALLVVALGAIAAGIWAAATFMMSSEPVAQVMPASTASTVCCMASSTAVEYVRISPT